MTTHIERNTKHKLVVLDPPLTQPDSSSTQSNGYPLVFLHIPKAAGTTLEAIINCVAAVHGREHRRIAGPLYHAPLGPGKTPVLHQLENMPDGGLSSLSFISGHLPFGIDNKLGGRGLYLTVLREPAARTVSHYKWGVRRGIWPEGTPVKELVASGHIPDNAMTRQLSGSRDPREQCNDEMLERAFNNLRHFPIVGILERFIETLQTLQLHFRWPGIIFQNYLSAPKNQKGPPDSPAVIEGANLFDANLYSAYAGRKTLFQKEAIDDASRSLLACEPSAQQINRYIISAPNITEGGARCGVLTKEEWEMLDGDLASKNFIIERHPACSMAVIS